jgi:hypothetical protein
MNSLLRFGFGALTAVFPWAITALPVLAQEGKPNVVFIHRFHEAANSSG